MTERFSNMAIEVTSEHRIVVAGDGKREDRHIEILEFASYGIDNEGKKHPVYYTVGKIYFRDKEAIKNMIMALEELLRFYEEKEND